MKKVCLVSFCNPYVLPYAKTYIDTIVNDGNECSLLFWDRDAVNGEKDDYPSCKKYCYQRKITPESSTKDKLFGYIGATKYFKDVIVQEQFDGLIFLQTHAAVACKSLLLRKYQNKYIIDVRDYTLENFKLYYRNECKVIEKAYATVISSPAYQNFLPKGEYVIAHNYTPFDQSAVKSVRERALLKQEGPINISFIGTVRFIEMDKKILNLFAGDNRFQINYYGTGAEVLERYCEEENILNVDFYGSFNPERTTAFYEHTDLINNLYGNNDRFLDDALSNKLYHAGQFYMPILVCPKTYMEEISMEYDMGFVFDVDKKDEPDRLYEWFSSLDRKKLEAGCERFINRVREENQHFYEVCATFVKEI